MVPVWAENNWDKYGTFLNWFYSVDVYDNLKQTKLEKKNKKYQGFFLIQYV